jgi:hypothetical protein
VESKRADFIEVGNRIEVTEKLDKVSGREGWQEVINRYSATVR